MSNTSVPDVYQWIIGRTISKVRGYWEENGLDARILEDIEREWEHKIIESDVAAFTPEQKLEQQEHGRLFQAGKFDPKRPVAVPAGPSGAGPRRDVAGAPPPAVKAEGAPAGNAVLNVREVLPARRPPQSDSAPKQAAADAGRLFGDDDDSDDNADGAAGDNDDSKLEDLGLSDDEDGDFETRNHVICQYEKVSRNKQRWRSKLRDGVVHLNGRDYIFQKADGEFDWI